MWWMMIGGAVAGGVGNDASSNAADRNTELSALNARTGNSTRTAKNAASAATTNLQRFVQSANNARRLKSGGDTALAEAQNYRRYRDSLATQTLSQQVGDSERAGAAAAAQAAARLEGGAVDAVNTSTALRNALVNSSLGKNAALADYDYTQRAGRIAASTAGGLDSSLILDSLDYNVDFAQVAPKLSRMAAIIRGAAPYAQAAIQAEASKAATNATAKDQDKTNNSNVSFRVQGVDAGGNTALSIGGQDYLERGAAKQGADFAFKKDDPKDTLTLWSGETVYDYTY
jgi:hypothetical protein